MNGTRSQDISASGFDHSLFNLTCACSPTLLKYSTELLDSLFNIFLYLTDREAFAGQAPSSPQPIICQQGGVEHQDGAQ